MPILNLPSNMLEILARRIRKTITRANAPPTPPPSDCDRISLNSSLIEDYTIPLPPEVPLPSSVLSIDLPTPDAQVPRDPRLIRLTGVHPFNSEAPLSDLFDSGFITPAALFYVRNHGLAPIPKIEALEWTISVEGLVERPFTISVAELMTNYPQVTLPVTLVCAGNRRAEQNRIKKSKGFSWGAAGVSTSLFTGPLLGDVLKSAGILAGARYVCMEGVDDLPHGRYATSLPLSRAMSEGAGVQLAYRMNGQELTPDHGWPLRVVVPGVIGGRSVKWISKLVVTSAPSDSYYHIYDNRVLPTMVTPEMAAGDDGKKWWVDERYAIYELGVNSAIVHPAHDEVLEAGQNGEYIVKGYAYAGGGRRVTRVEVSLNKGKSWTLANIDYPEDLYRAVPDGTVLYGGRLDMARRDTCFCWCFWDLAVDVGSLTSADDILVRAMDDSMNMQPRDQYWSVLGMMNNSWFRVAIRKESEGARRFEHPTLPALKAGGWMERVKLEGGDLLGPNWGEKQDGVVREEKIQEEEELVSMIDDKVTRIITMEELEAHNAAGEPWFAVEGHVYDGTGFLKDHPGGPSSIAAVAGQDATREFIGIHSQNARSMMPAYHIGILSDTGKSDFPTPPATPSPVFLNPRTWRSSKLLRVESISPDTRIFTFALDAPGQPLGLPIGQHLFLSVSTPTGVVTRPYTPISSPTTQGVVRILIKLYLPSETCFGGRMSAVLADISPGATVSIKGPIGKLTYSPSPTSLVNLDSCPSPIATNSFTMICAGSGITPIFQVLSAALSTSSGAMCTVIYANRTESDILCRTELDEFARCWPQRCKLTYALSRPDDTWDGERGRVDLAMLGRLCGEKDPATEGMALICGPKGFESVVDGALKDLGWQKDRIVFF